MKHFFSIQPSDEKKLRAHKRGYLLLDFDGTLSPIVKNPARARMSESLRKQLNAISKNSAWKVAVVSGRGLSFLKKRANISKAVLVGNHGFEILAPGKKVHVHPAAKKSRKLIQQLCRELKDKLKKVPGVLMENKIWSATMHTRNAASKNEKKALNIFRSVVQKPLFKRFIKVTAGKRVCEIRPPAKWNKGEAVKYILKREKKNVFPIYFGDDKTDEDAFRAVRTHGWGIKVGRGKSAAQYYIRSTKERNHALKILGTLFV